MKNAVEAEDSVAALMKIKSQEIDFYHFRLEYA